MIIAIFNMIFTPYYYGFYSEFKTSTMYQLSEIFTILFYIADIVVNFRTTYIDDKNGEEITDLYKIAENYIKSTLILDVIAIFPWEYIFIHRQYFSMMRNIKFTRTWKLNQIISFMQVEEDYKAVMILAKLGVMILMYLHWMACFWWSVVKQDRKWTTLQYMTTDDMWGFYYLPRPS